MVFASPLELAATTALSNWFIRRRALILALFGVTQGTGLAAMPLVAQWLIRAWGWRQAWRILGLYTLMVGVVPAVLLLVRRPEDMGLAVAVGAAGTAGSSTLTSGSVASAILGGGVGGLHMLLRLAWAEYYGRPYLGTIQGVTLPVPLVGQALGPVTAGFVFDVTGTYRQAFLWFAGVVLLGSACVLTATPPRSPED